MEAYSTGGVSSSAYHESQWRSEVAPKQHDGFTQWRLLGPWINRAKFINRNSKTVNKTRKGRLRLGTGIQQIRCLRKDNLETWTVGKAGSRWLKMLGHIETGKREMRNARFCLGVKMKTLATLLTINSEHCEEHCFN